MSTKLIGIIIGAIVAGPIGAIVGFLLGMYVDSQMGYRSKKPFRWQRGFSAQYLEAMFTLMGYVAKADGQISQNEIALAGEMMRRLRLSTAQKIQAMRWFYNGKNQQFNLDATLQQLKAARFGIQNRLLIQCLSSMVSVNGRVHPEQKKILLHICTYLGLPAPQFYHQHYQQNGGQRQARNPFSQVNPVTSAYKTLGVSQKTSNDEVKKAYRRLMSKHHPDKLASKQASDEEVKQASAKTHAIRSAYEAVMQSRGVSF